MVVLRRKYKERNIKITAKQGTKDYVQVIPVHFKNEETENSSIAAYWARQKISEIYKNNRFTTNPNLEEAVTALGLKYSIMSEFTSFIAVDDATRNTTGQVDTQTVPLYEVEWKDYQQITNYKHGGVVQISSGDFSLSPRGGINFGAQNISAQLKGSSNSASVSSDAMILSIAIIVVTLLGILGIIYGIYTLITQRMRKTKGEKIHKSE